MSAQIDEAMCIRRIDWSETSQIVWLFARRLGVVRALAKGSKRPKAPFSGGIELLTVGDAGIILRPNSELALLTRWDLRQSFPALRRSLAAFSAGLYVADLIAHLVRDHDPHPGLFNAAIRALEALQDEQAIPGALLRLQWSALGETGFRPEIRADVLTGEDLAAAPVYLFNPALGGLLADDGTGGTDSGAAWRVRGRTVDLLRSLPETDLNSPPTATSQPQVIETENSESIDRANRLLASYIRHVLGVEPPTMRAVFGSRLMR